MPHGHELTEINYPSADYEHKVACRSYSDADLAARADQIAAARALRLQQRALKNIATRSHKLLKITPGEVNTLLAAVVNTLLALKPRFTLYIYYLRKSTSSTNSLIVTKMCCA